MSTYEPVLFPKMPTKSEKEIKTLTKSLYQIFSFRRTIRDFSDTPISEEVIQNCIKIVAMVPNVANH